uniref:Uncharacterized protein n=1 Tax=Phakopsora pachyrhizi TaxID=170000 RepID=A0A0S1MIA8_PHAPC
MMLAVVVGLLLPPGAGFLPLMKTGPKLISWFDDILLCLRLDFFTFTYSL